MTQAQAKLMLAQALRSAGLDPTVYRPSEYLATLGGWGTAWAELVAQAEAEIQAGVWEGGLLPHGYPAPQGAEPGATYWVLLPNGSVICQYGDSPYAPETPGLAPGRLTRGNVEAAMRAHVRALAESLAAERLTQGYLEWVAEQL